MGKDTTNNLHLQVIDKSQLSPTCDSWQNDVRMYVAKIDKKIELKVRIDYVLSIQVIFSFFCGMKKALIITVAKLPVKIYGHQTPLPGTRNDAKNMSIFLRKQGYDVTVLETKKATHKALESYIKKLQHRRGKFILYYSGHGTQKYNSNSTEFDKMDEAWCLYDGIYTDKRLHETLSALHPKLNTLVISDSCHSDGMLKSSIGFGAGLVVAKSINTNQVKDCFFFCASSKKKLAKVLEFSGCKSWETSAEMLIAGVPQGNLTYHILNEYKEGMRYRELYAAVGQVIRYQTPQLSYLGKGYYIKNQKAFG